MASVVETGPDAVAAVIERPSSYIDWPGVFVGVLIALAMSWLLLSFGSAVGLLAISPYSFTAQTGATLTIAAAVWFALTQIYSLGLGAYIAARLRPRAEGPGGDELTFRDGISGLSVWALSIVLGLFIAAGATLSVARTGAEAVTAAASSTAQGLDSAYVVDLLFRPANAAEAQSQPAAGASTAQTETTGEDTAGQPAQPGAPEATPSTAVTANGQAVQSVDEDTRSLAGRIISRALADGEIDANDKAYLAQIISERTGMSQQQAQQRIDQTIEQAKSTALAAADEARQAASLLGFWIVFIMLVTGVACWWAGTLGGHHRDEGTLY
jgi:hypothetical protein